MQGVQREWRQGRVLGSDRGFLQEAQVEVGSMARKKEEGQIFFFFFFSPLPLLLLLIVSLLTT